MDLSRGPAWATWFTGGTVNLAHNCVDRWAERTPDALAVVWEGDEGPEAGAVRRVTYAELREMADRLAHGLRSLGVGPGDAVGIFLPMAPETVAATLACAKVGAVYLPIFSGYAADAVATRLADAEAKVLITADGFPRRGKDVAMKETADAAADMVPSVRQRRSCGRATAGTCRGTPAATCGGTSCWPPSRRGSRPSRSTASIRCSSPTPRGRRAGPRGRCTSTAGSW